MKAKASEAVLWILLVLFGITLWLTLSQLLPKLSWDEAPLIASAVLATLFLFVAWGVLIMVSADAFWSITAWAAVSFSGLIWFYDLPFLAASTLVFLAGVIGYFRARMQIHKTLEGGLVRPLRRALPLAATMMSAAIAAAAFQVSPPPSLDVRELLPKEYFVKLVSAVVPEASFDAATTDSLYAFTVEYIHAQVERYKEFFPIAFAVGFFFTLRLGGIVLYWLAIGVVAILLRLLQKFGIVELRSIPRNVVVYSFR